MKLGLETESCHLLFQHGRMDLFKFIELASELGLDGVTINVIPDLNLHPTWGTLELGDDPVYLLELRGALDEHGMICEVDTRGTSIRELSPVLKAAKILGARTIRTYVRYLEFEPAVLYESADELRAVLPILQDLDLRIAIENHEYERMSELMDVLKRVDNQRIGICYDTGNSMMAWEDPLQAARLANPIYSVHFKDHTVVLDHEFGWVVCGVPLGDGNINLEEMWRILSSHKELDMINLELCYPYCATFKRDLIPKSLSSEAFMRRDPPFPKELISPMQYYYPHKVSARALEMLIDAQIEGVRRSAKILKNLRSLKEA